MNRKEIEKISHDLVEKHGVNNCIMVLEKETGALGIVASLQKEHRELLYLMWLELGNTLVKENEYPLMCNLMKDSIKEIEDAISDMLISRIESVKLN